MVFWPIVGIKSFRPGALCRAKIRSNLRKGVPPMGGGGALDIKKIGSTEKIIRGGEVNVHPPPTTFAFLFSPGRHLRSQNSCPPCGEDSPPPFPPLPWETVTRQRREYQALRHFGRGDRKTPHPNQQTQSLSVGGSQAAYEAADI